MMKKHSCRPRVAPQGQLSHAHEYASVAAHAATIIVGQQPVRRDNFSPPFAEATAEHHLKKDVANSPSPTRLFVSSSSDRTP